MKRFLIAFGIAVFSAAGCTSVTENGLTIDTGFKKITVDKDTQQAIAASVMKQLNQAASAITPAVSQSVVAAPRFARLEAHRRRSTPFVSLAVTADQCMKLSDVTCTADGLKCEYTEDYTACGKDFGGKIKRTFSGDYSKYRIDVDFDKYSEKPTSDTAHFGFDGTTSLTGSVVGDISLQMHQEGVQELVVSSHLVSMKGSATFTVSAINNQTILDGTQTGKVQETGQTESISYTKVTLDPSCASGPISGKMTVTVDAKEAVTEITGCGKGTVTIDGEATPLTADDLKATFLPGENAQDEGLAGLGDATSPDSLLLGDWSADTGTVYGNLSFYDNGDGTTAIYLSVSRDNDGNGTFDTIGDTYEYGSGIVTFSNGTADVTFDYYEFGTYTQSGITTDNSLSHSYTYTIDGNGSLTFDGIPYTKYVDVVPPPQVNNPLNGYWLYSASNVTGTTAYEMYYLYDDLAGYTYIYYDLENDVNTDGYVMNIGDSYDWYYGTFTNDAGTTTISPMWDFIGNYNYIDDGYGYPVPDTGTTVYDSSAQGGVQQTGTPFVYTFDDLGDTDPANDTLTIGSKVFARW